MSKDSFFKQVKSLRSILDYKNQHSVLDNIVETVSQSSEDEMDEESLEEEVARIIIKIKKAKENDKLRVKSKELIEQIKKSLED